VHVPVHCREVVRWPLKVPSNSKDSVSQLSLHSTERTSKHSPHGLAAPSGVQQCWHSSGSPTSPPASKNAICCRWVPSSKGDSMSRFASFNSKHVITASVLRFLYTLPLRPDPGDTEYRTRLPGAPPPPLPAQRSAAHSRVTAARSTARRGAHPRPKAPTAPLPAGSRQGCRLARAAARQAPPRGGTRAAGRAPLRSGPTAPLRDPALGPARPPPP